MSDLIDYFTDCTWSTSSTENIIERFWSASQTPDTRSSLIQSLQRGNITYHHYKYNQFCCVFKSFTLPLRAAVDEIMFYRTQIQVYCIEQKG